MEGIIPHAVRKRTPRVPVLYSDRDNREKTISPTKQNLKHNLDVTDDDVTHEIAMALTEASQKGGSPRVSRMPYRKIGGSMLTPLRNGERMVSFSFVVLLSWFYLILISLSAILNSS